MQFTREINRLLIGVLLAFALVGLGAAYWAIIGADTILLREDNPRRVEAEIQLIRGDIVDLNGTPLVTSVQNPDRSITRRYLYPEMSSALGYSSLRYGVSGAEAAYNDILRGDDLPQDLGMYLSNDLLHHPQQGSNVRLTFDLVVQKAAAQALNGKRGAIVVVAIPGGEVMALVSAPSYDPNSLDADWETLTKDPDNPFFNRGIQGSYQPGGLLQTPLLAAALLAEFPMNTPVMNATQSVQIANTQLNCAVVLPPLALTIREAYAFGCPAAFGELASDLGMATVQAAFDTFLLDRSLTLPGYVVLPPANPTPSPDGLLLTTENFLENVLGQGRLTVTPLEVAVMTGSVVNDGNAPTPYTLIEIQRPESSDWTPVQTLHLSQPFMTANTARQIQDMMRLAVAEGAAQNAGRPNMDIGGHAALAYSGNESQAWFTGFVTLGGRRGIAIAIVLENSSDPGLAADIGGTVLAVAHTQLAAKGN